MKKLRLLLGGSPCTHWSIAQKNNRETEPEGLGWELFKNFIIAKEKVKSDYFLYENNKSMAKPIRNQIDVEFNRTYAENTNWELISSVEEDKGHTKRWLWRNKTTGKTEYITRILINSALVSAQNRQRYYWTNIPNVKQPADRGILLKDILESGVDLSQKEKSYCLTASYNGAVVWNTLERGQRTMVAVPIQDGGMGAKTGLYATPIEPACVAQRGRYVDTGNRTTKGVGGTEQFYEARTDGKTNVITTVTKDNLVAVPIQGGGMGAKTGLYAIPIEFADSVPVKAVSCADGKTYPVYTVANGLITIKDKQYPINLPDGLYIIRKFTVKECMRLQTVREDYIFPVSNCQAYKMLGNGWTVDVIAHILSHIPHLQDYELEVLSIYDGMSCGNLALEKLGCKIARYVSYEIDKWAIETTQANFPFVEQRGDAFQIREPYWQYDNGQLMLAL